MEPFPSKLTKKLVERETNKALRTLSVPDGMVDLCSNDYLSMARNEGVYAWASQFIADKDMLRNGATGSRLLSGNHILYPQLEQLLKSMHKAKEALVFNSGYDANIGFFATIPQRGDLVYYDELVHASIRDGMALGQAKCYKFSHNDLSDLNTKLGAQMSNRAKDGTDQEIYVITESVFSMDGDSPDLTALLALCAKHKCRLVVDEAHAVGILGDNGGGLIQHLELHDQVFARLITFGKAMGAHGAAILGGADLRRYLINFARSFIYTTALPPHSVATIMASYYFSVTQSGIDKRKSLLEMIAYFKGQIKEMQLEEHFITSNSAIHCCLIPGNERVKGVAHQLQQQGFDVRPILAPTVPQGGERLRFCLHVHNTRAELREVLQLLSNLLQA